jgi:hypothetical protein
MEVHPLAATGFPAGDRGVRRTPGPDFVPKNLRRLTGGKALSWHRDRPKPSPAISGFHGQGRVWRLKPGFAGAPRRPWREAALAKKSKFHVKNYHRKTITLMTHSNSGSFFS